MLNGPISSRPARSGILSPRVTRAETVVEKILRVPEPIALRKFDHRDWTIPVAHGFDRAHEPDRLRWLLLPDVD